MDESLFNKKWVLHLCVFAVWIIYCFYYWSFFNWNNFKKELVLIENSWVKGACYVLVELTAILWSMFVDIFPALSMVPILIFALSLCIFIHNIEVLDDDNVSVSLRDSLHHSMIILIVPIASKFFAWVFKDHHLNTFFCFLHICIIGVKVLDKYINPKNCENLHIFVLTVVIFSLILMSKLRLQNKRIRENTVNSCRWMWLLKKPLLFNAALCSFLHKFEQTIMMHDYMTTYPNTVFTVGQSSEQHYDISGCCGCLILLLIIRCHQNRIIHCLYYTQFIFFPVLCVSVILLHFQMISTPLIIILGIYFPPLETFLAGPVAVRAGNYYDGCGVAAATFINTCMHLGEVAALIVIYVVPTVKLYTVLISFFVFIHVLQNLYTCTQETLLQM